MSHQNPNKYGFSVNEEDFYGAYDTWEEAALACFSGNPDNDIAYVGATRLLCISDFIGIASILKEIIESVTDEVGEAAEDWGSSLLNDEPYKALLKNSIAASIALAHPLTFCGLGEVKQFKRADFL